MCEHGRVLTGSAAITVCSIAIPGISSGIFGGPKNICARTIIGAAVDYLQNSPDSFVREVHFCNIDAETASALEVQARRIFVD